MSHYENRTFWSHFIVYNGMKWIFIHYLLLCAPLTTPTHSCRNLGSQATSVIITKGGWCTTTQIFLRFSTEFFSQHSCIADAYEDPYPIQFPSHFLTCHLIQKTSLPFFPGWNSVRGPSYFGIFSAPVTDNNCKIHLLTRKFEQMENWFQIWGPNWNPAFLAVALSLRLPFPKHTQVLSTFGKLAHHAPRSVSLA